MKRLTQIVACRVRIRSCAIVCRQAVRFGIVVDVIDFFDIKHFELIEIRGVGQRLALQLGDAGVDLSDLCLVVPAGGRQPLQRGVDSSVFGKQVGVGEAQTGLTLASAAAAADCLLEQP